MGRMVVEALQDRLNVLEDEILRITQLASQSSELIRQDNYWQLAQDLQRETRELRAELSRMLEAPGAVRIPAS
jgi:hypothetical protein